MESENRYQPVFYAHARGKSPELTRVEVRSDTTLWPIVRGLLRHTGLSFLHKSLTEVSSVLDRALAVSVCLREKVRSSVFKFVKMGCSNTKAFPAAADMETNGTLTNAMNVLNAIDSQVMEEGEKIINQAQEVIGETPKLFFFNIY